MGDATPLNSDATATDRRILELLMVVMMTHYSRLRKEGADNDDAREIVVGQEQQMTEILREGMTTNTRAVYMDLLMVTQRLLDAQLRLLDGVEKGRVEVSSSASDDHQLMDSAAAAKKKGAAAAAAKKKKKRNKSAAKRKGTKLMSRLGGGIISLLMMAALIVSLLPIHQSDGSSGGKAPHTLPPSTSLRQRDFQSSMSSMPIITSPSPAPVVEFPIFSPSTDFNPRMNSVERALSTCLDTPKWEDKFGDGCDIYEEWEDPGCANTDFLAGYMGPATKHCCHCGGGNTLPTPTTSPTITNSPTKSSTPSSSPSSTPSSSPTKTASPSSSPTISANPTQFCFDTPNWRDKYGLGCGGYERWYDRRCPDTDHRAGNMGPATEHCCYCGKEPCVDTPNWNDGVHGCTWYEENDSLGCPKYGELFGEKVMGLAKDHCCYCKRPVVALVTPSAPPSISTSPTVSLSPTSSICINTPGWYDYNGYDCVWYEIMDDPGCPKYGSRTAFLPPSTPTGLAKDNCCYCKNDVVSTFSPTKAPSSSGACVDTPDWKDEWGYGCEHYQEVDDPGCPNRGNTYPGNKGPAAENCCYCKDPTCKHFNWKCQYYTKSTFWWEFIPDNVTSVCDKAASSCYECETADHVKIVTNFHLNESVYFNETVELYNECRCDFWSRLCEDTRGSACDYAAEYCCGDYRYYELLEQFYYLNSPRCYCDFFNYAENQFGHKLKPKALNISKEFPSLCREDDWSGIRTAATDFEKENLEAIYKATNGHNWTNNTGWMNETVEHCQWYGISCNVEGFVASIDLRDNNLFGRFPVYTHDVTSLGYPVLDTVWLQSKYGLANLKLLKMLDLANNKLTGTIEYGPLYNLNALTHFDVSGNQFSGQVEALVAPSLTYVDFSSNSFTSMRRFKHYKISPLQTLRYCDVSNNVIQQDATDLLEKMPPSIEHFIASNNEIYGSLPDSLNNLQKLRQFNMSSNALSGELPGFTESFATLQELDISNQMNGCTGLIPENVWRSLSLKTLNLAGNRLTGTIPSLVGNLAVLEVFDLSKNLLESSIPSELGLLEGSLKRLGLSNNALSGRIPSQIGQLQGASILLKNNHFHDNSIPAPLSLCVLLSVEEFDLADNTTLCPIERNALSDFYDSAKGAEWTDQGNKTDGTNWLDEYASHCNWTGVTCDNDKNHVIKLNLTNNGLSGRLSESIGHLTFIEELDLSDNDIKGSIPIEIGLLSNLTYLRLSYNAFTGAAPEGLGRMKGLQLLQLQSNRITKMPNIPRLDDSIHGQSTFVTDCGVPSAFDEALECKSCTMCCNANDDCYPQEETQVNKWGLNYGTFAAVLLACFVAFCVIAARFLYLVDKRKNKGKTCCIAALSLFFYLVDKCKNCGMPNLTMSMEPMSEEDDKYALSKIGKKSVYSYFVTNNFLGWLAALLTLFVQTVILIFFILASEANLQDDKIDIKFTWKCPRDTDVCKNKATLDKYGWAIFGVLMAASLARDLIGGTLLIHHSAKTRHTLCARLRYFFGGMFLCSITLLALYATIAYNKAIATSNTEVIVNSVIVLFVMALDEWIFSALAAWNKKWTAHVEDGTIDELKEELRKLREIVDKIQESQAAAAAAAATTSDSETFHSCFERYEDDTEGLQECFR